MACAAPLADGDATAREVRKTVTVLFCDVVGSTELGERFDPEVMRGVMARPSRHRPRRASARPRGTRPGWPRPRR